ncbi:MAG: serine hydrolase [Calditrichaeota bacterium]|nr:MAG: serine hydrolase [Calditrichota bacterium]MBL1206446.1 serine hydrolase [Calditrichota bacterium]NOG46273.1 serine hydrolase [Calditrichota bacterium]
MKNIFMLIIFIVAGLISFTTAKVDPVLQKKLEKTVVGFEGEVGIFVKNLSTGKSASINSEKIFPTASMIKVPILLTIFDKINLGELKYNQELIYKDSLLYPGSDLLGSFKDGEKITLSKLVMLMITTSDNTASLWLQHLAGTGTDINGYLSDNGFEMTRVNSRTEGRKEDWQKYGWGQTTPKEMAELLVSIHQGKAVGKSADEEMYRVLCNIYLNDVALTQIPPFVQAASKQGAVSQSRSEVVLVNGPSGDYVFCVITKNQKDTSWDFDNAGYVLIRQISNLLWDYFEPGLEWKPAEGFEKWAK